MPIVFQHVCDNRLQEKDRLFEELQQSSSLAMTHKDVVLNVVNNSNTQLWEARDAYMTELRTFHQLRVQDLQKSVQQHQYRHLALVVVMMVIVVTLMMGFLRLFSTQTKEKSGLEAQNHQYESDIKEKIESQRNQYESIILEKTGRIEQLEREKQEQQRIDQESQESVSSSMVAVPHHMASPHLPMVYAFPGGIPQMGCGTNSSNPIVMAKA